MSDSIKIAELERLDAEATPGPWHRVFNGPPGHCAERILSVADVENDGPDGPTVAFTSYEGLTEGFGDGDAHLIAAARNALPALLRLARASDRYAWMLSKDGPGEDEEHVVIEIVAEWCAARAAFDFGPTETA